MMNSNLDQEIQKLPNNFEIKSKDDYARITEVLKGVKALRNKIAEAFDSEIKKANDLHKSLLAKKKTYDQPCEAVEIKIKNEMGRWVLAEQKKEREEQARKEAEIRKQLEDEALKNAQVLADQNKMDEAQEEIEQAIIAPVVVEVEKRVEKIENVSTSKQWKWDLVDISKVDRRFLKIDEVRINQQVRAMGKDAEKLVGGIVVSEKVNITVRG